MMLKVRNEKIGSEGCTRGIVYQKWVHRKGVGELLGQCNQCNYNYRFKTRVILMPLIMQLILIYTNVVSHVDLGWSLTQVLESRYYRYTHKHQGWMLFFLPILGVNLTFLGGNFWVVRFFVLVINSPILETLIMTKVLLLNIVKKFKFALKLP